MELQQHQAAGLTGGYGLYRSSYNNAGVPGGDAGSGFPGNRGHLGGYPFPPMPGQNSYGYHHLGYPTSQSPGKISLNFHVFVTIKKSVLHGNHVHSWTFSV
jgi:hypothetical protein